MNKIISCILFLVIISSLFAEDINILSSSEKGIAFEFRVPAFSVTPLLIDNKEYKIIDIRGTGMINDIGKPALPVRYIYVALPLETENVKIYVKKEGKQTIKNARIIPVFQMTWKDQKIEEDPAIYGKNAYFPGKDYEVLYDKILLHQRIVKIAIYPFHFNPYINELISYNTIKVKIMFLGGKQKEGEYRFLGIPNERRLKNLIINYNKGQSWRKKKKVGRGSLLNYTPWYKIKVSEDGVYKIDYNYLKNHNINPDNIDPRTIKVYNGGSSVLNDDILIVPGENDTIPYQIPIYIHGEDDGEFNKDDYILFYGLSLTGWERCSVSVGVPLFYNPFTDTNVYWLTWGENEGKRMEVVDGSPSFNEPYTPSCFKKTIHIEENHLCPSKSGFGWVWEEVVLPTNVSSISRNYAFSVKNLYSDSFEVFTAVYGATTGTHCIELQMKSIPFSDTCWAGMNYTAPFTWLSGGTNLSSGDNTITVRVHKGGGGDKIYIDYFEVSFYKNYKAFNNVLEFSIKEDAPVDTIYEFNLNGFSESPYIFDITSPFNTKRITGSTFNYGTVKFQIFVSQEEKKKCIATKVFKTPESITEGNPNSLRNVDKADYIIVTHKKFYYAASELRDWRRNHLLGVQNPTIKIVMIDEIFDNFSWGLSDPVAIRNFFYYAANFWEYPPGYVLLFGGGSYDYKNLFKSQEPKNSIPVYETGDYVHFQELMSHNPCYEDFFTDFTGDLLCDIPIGRITVVTQEEAGDVVNKIINYETNNLGSWKNRIILLADDEFDYKGIDGLYRFHISGTEGISQLVPGPFDQTKVYLTEYPGTNPGAVPPGSKPQARSALIEALDKGALLGTFLGHGNLRQLTHELVFHRADVGMLENDYREPFFYFGSCSVGDFDRAEEESIADLLQKSCRRGAIATLACTRTSGYSSITVLGKELVTNILGNKNVTLGDGVFLSKKNANFGKTYAFFGDPATPSFPDSIGFQATISSETLVGGRKILIDGQTDDPGFNGFLFAAAYDPIKRISHAVPTTSDTIRYNLPGNSIFKGIFNITGGKIDAAFFIPTKLDSGNTGRISMYIWGDAKEGRRSLDSLITGIDDTLSTDSIPPDIEIYHSGKLLGDGMSIPSDAEIIGVLEDESGIDITGRENRSIYLAINEDYTHIKKINDYFFYDINSSTKGSFRYALGLESTMKTVRLEFTCYDNCENQAVKVLDLNVYSGEEFSLSNVYNFPNPFKKTTYFTYFLSHRSSVTLTVFTITGKTIYKKNIVCEPGFNRILWDGRDADGDRIANGVYFYKIKAQASDAQDNFQSKVEYRGKIAIAR